MWEKLKDLLYEISDILLALVIIFFMSTTIAWQVTDSLASSKVKDTNLNKSIETEEVNKEAQDTSAKVETNLPIANEEKEETTSPSTDESNTQSEEVAEETVAPTPEPKPQPTVVHIEIPSGTSGMGIAKILKGKGLIEDTTQFINRLEALKMASKLKSGTFDIQTNSSLDDVIYTIVGKKK